VTWGEPSVRAGGEVRHVLDPSLPEQGYELRIDGDGARLSHADEAGLRYGEQTVSQLRSDDASLPAVHIRDWPDVTTRGFMLDVSRDRVPTRATLERLVAILVTARYNHLQLYIEHAYAYAGHEDVWRDASPITADDLRWLDDLCHANGIQLAANQNCFGHMGRWLALDRYRDRAECPDGIEPVAGLRLPPSVLAPTDGNARFALELVREQAASLRSRLVNIGCDETFELGRGHSADRAAEIGVVGVYLEHLQRLVGPLVEEGRSVQVWGDVVAHHPERVADLPAGDLTALVWNYDAPEAPTPDLSPRLAAVLAEIGIDLETPTDFATRVAPFVEAGRPFWVVPGTSSWNSLVGRWDNARANLLDAAQVAASSGAGGYLVTDWGDNGHHQPPSVSDVPILYGGAVSWCAGTNGDLDVATVADRLVYDDPTATIGRAVEAIGQAGSATGRVARNLSPLFAALLPHQAHLVGGTADRDAVASVIATLDAARSDLAAARPRAADGATVVEELDVAIGLARHGAVRLGTSAGLEDPGADIMHADLAGLIARYQEVWLRRSRPGGLADSVAHLERTNQRL
jgi:hypothetical protein